MRLVKYLIINILVSYFIWTYCKTLYIIEIFSNYDVIFNAHAFFIFQLEFLFLSSYCRKCQKRRKCPISPKFVGKKLSEILGLQNLFRTKQYREKNLTIKLYFSKIIFDFLNQLTYLSFQIINRKWRLINFLSFSIWTKFPLLIFESLWRVFTKPVPLINWVEPTKADKTIPNIITLKISITVNGANIVI